MSALPRLFYAVLVPPELQKAIAELQDRLRQAPARVNWVQPANLHFTLKFLGEAPDGLVPKLIELGEATGRRSGPITVDLRGVGAFPKARHPRAVWVGTGEGAAGLGRLAETLAAALAEAGLALGDDKPFAAHCTIGRVKDGGGEAFREALQAEAGFRAGRLRADEFHLIGSELSRSGPTYSTLARFPLLAPTRTGESDHEAGGPESGCHLGGGQGQAG